MSADTLVPAFHVHPAFLNLLQSPVPELDEGAVMTAVKPSSLNAPIQCVRFRTGYLIKFRQTNEITSLDLFFCRLANR